MDLAPPGPHKTEARVLGARGPRGPLQTPSSARHLQGEIPTTGANDMPGLPPSHCLILHAGPHPCCFPLSHITGRPPPQLTSMGHSLLDTTCHPLHSNFLTEASRAPLGYTQTWCRFPLDRPPPPPKQLDPMVCRQLSTLHVAAGSAGAPASSTTSAGPGRTVGSARHNN